MTTEPAIRVTHLSKKFARSLKRAMWYGLVDISRAALVPHRYRSSGLAARVTDETRASGSPDALPSSAPDAAALRATEFWALRDVNFELRRGDCVGVVGHNGAGKSTLFSLLSGIYGPTEGRIEVHGRLQALIALGAGFHPSLTGRENIYINASIFGLTTREIDAIYDDIVAFSELAEFIDMPVKNYSSGMFVRLGFSVAVHLKPDILLIDEVLSVGDIAFQNKSFARIRSIIDSGVPALFVSHYPQAVEAVCTRALWLEHGRIRMTGDVKSVIVPYVEEMTRVRLKGGADAAGDSPIVVTRAEVLDRHGQATERVAWGGPFTVRLHYACAAAVANPYFVVSFRRPGAATWEICRCSMADDGVDRSYQPGSGYVDCTVESASFCPGPYVISCAIVRSRTSTIGQALYQKFFDATSLWLVGEPGEIGRPGMLRSTINQQPPLLTPHRWADPTPAPGGVS